MIQEIRRIVVGIDLSETGDLSAGSRLAVEQARWVANIAGAHVTLLHSIRCEEHWSVSEGAFADRPMPVDDGFRRSLEAALQSLREAGIEAELVLSDERAWLAIVEKVLQFGADLVIVGKRAESVHDGRLLGGVSQKLLRKCPCAVWVVKPDDTAGPVNILAATDLSPVGDRVVALAASISSECGAELHIVHALQLPLLVQMQDSESEEQFLAESRAAAVAEIESQLPEPLRGAAKLHVGLTSPSNAILACVDRLNPDLVVMGTISRAGIAGLSIGNTAERMLGHLDCSMLTVKPADFVCPVRLGED
ncbi:MAG: universal stress protein [Deltaproteobacteria bacterium]|nr:universal stress protein [Deltaproteobacteria bacterium]MBW2576671.1 universal stress protein [Deltaproteobacteria bacterium]MBW2691329.1 universal stress protein [Deltaproteobacteria bacterium]